MSSSKSNNTYKKTSFLAGTNSSFIEKFYSDYLSDPKKLPEDWRLFFDGLKENEEVIQKDLQGPSWSLRKKSIIKSKNNDNNMTSFTTLTETMKTTNS